LHEPCLPLPNPGQTQPPGRTDGYHENQQLERQSARNDPKKKNLVLIFLLFVVDVISLNSAEYRHDYDTGGHRQDGKNCTSCSQNRVARFELIKIEKGCRPQCRRIFIELG
jgi:hypothetical protein